MKAKWISREETNKKNHSIVLHKSPNIISERKRRKKKSDWSRESDSATEKKAPTRWINWGWTNNKLYLLMHYVARQWKNKVKRGWEWKHDKMEIHQCEKRVKLLLLPIPVWAFFYPPPLDKRKIHNCNYGPTTRCSSEISEKLNLASISFDWFRRPFFFLPDIIFWCCVAKGSKFRLFAATSPFARPRFAR